MWLRISFMVMTKLQLVQKTCRFGQPSVWRPRTQAAAKRPVHPGGLSSAVRFVVSGSSLHCISFFPRKVRPSLRILA